MCTMIYAVLPSDASRNLLDPVIEQYEMAFQPLDSKWLAGRPGQLLRATRRWCDCGTVIGSGYNRIPTEEIEEDLEKRLKELKRAGWSQSKVERWLAEKDRAKEKRHAERIASGDAFEVQLAKWSGFLPALLHTGGADWVGLVYHWHTGQEIFEIGAEITVPIDELTPELLQQMAPDTLYKFLRSRKPPN